MANYDFSTLNSTDLEELVCDLLNVNQPAGSKIRYKTFKDGKDKGIDFLYSSDTNEYEHIGQVKHYYRTGYGGLCSHLKSTERDKVKKLDPNKYIFATSVDLSVANTEEILNLFTPYIKNLQDIYGKKDLNRIIEENDKVLENHYKLWFSDSTILRKILRSDIDFRSAHFTEQELKRRLRIYVKTPIFDHAREFLKKNKFILITGDPGVGKTTLAEMLVYEFLRDDYELIYVDDDIKDAEKAISHDSKKQVVYYDDFLGSNEVEINKAKGSETSLLKIIRRITNLENKLLVFTTRSLLLTSAIADSEKLKRFNIKSNETIFGSEEFDESLKKQLLINHIEESKLNGEFKDIIRSGDLFSFIIKHQNFAPRSIEFITSMEILQDVEKDDYETFIRRSLDSPEDIWEHAYSKQILKEDRLLLNTLLSFGDSALYDELNEAFRCRLELEVKTSNWVKQSHAFHRSIKRLDGGFILVKNRMIYFINPSLVDFLVSYIRKDQDEIKRISEAVVYTSQLTQRLFSLSTVREYEIPDNIKDRLLKDYKSFLSKKENDKDLIKLALVIYRNIKTPKASSVVEQILNDIRDWSALYSDYSLNFFFREFMQATRGDGRINSIIEERILEILTELVFGENDLFDAVDLLSQLIGDYDIRLQNLNTSEIEIYLEQLLHDHIMTETEWLRDYITEESEADDKKREISNLIERINDIGLKISYDFDEFDSEDWFEIATYNEIQRQMEKDD